MSSTTRHNGDAIRALRIKAGRKPGELAALARISYPHLDNLENGRVEASVEVIHRIANALDVPPRALVRDPAFLQATTAARSSGPAPTAADPNTPNQVKGTGE